MAKRMLTKILGIDEGYLLSPKAGSWNTVLLPAINVTAGKVLGRILSPSGTATGCISGQAKSVGALLSDQFAEHLIQRTVSTNVPLSGHAAGY